MKCIIEVSPVVLWTFSFFVFAANSWLRFVLCQLFYKFVEIQLTDVDVDVVLLVGLIFETLFKFLVSFLASNLSTY